MVDCGARRDEYEGRIGDRGRRWWIEEQGGENRKKDSGKENSGIERDVPGRIN
ncbi:hypothetical protein [Methanosarcina sp. KYL-1]|uniref:hypothetical protein n=1 Tax=Methanosarcina sp. KYL-1 TaxID=2602068 RepID=UPI002100B498|nr:hypothetical protein [Methanosarcina sp. KYL-1]